MFEVFSFTLIHFLAKTVVFSGGYGLYKIVVEILEGWERYFSGQKVEILGRRGWGLTVREIPESVVGVWIFSGTTQCSSIFI